MPSGFFTALLGLIWYEAKASEARVNKRIDELRDDMKEIRQDVKTLLLQQAAKQPVTPER